MNTNNKYLNHLAYEVQVMLNCNTDDANKIVAAAHSIGVDPIKLVGQLPALAYGTKHNPNDILTALEDERITMGAQRATVCFPAGYKNRKQRRAERKKKRR